MAKSVSSAYSSDIRKSIPSFCKRQNLPKAVYCFSGLLFCAKTKTLRKSGAIGCRSIVIAEKEFVACGFKRKAGPISWHRRWKTIIHRKLISENRSRMKIMLFDPTSDIAKSEIRSILIKSLGLAKQKSKLSRAAF